MNGSLYQVSSQKSTKKTVDEDPKSAPTLVDVINMARLTRDSSIESRRSSNDSRERKSSHTSVFLPRKSKAPSLEQPIAGEIPIFSFILNLIE